jgi:osmotically-inducible protein OsmY
MARNQDYQYGSRYGSRRSGQSGDRWRDDERENYSGASDRDFGDYGNYGSDSNWGSGSAGQRDYSQADSENQSGSAGRGGYGGQADYGRNTGQGRYGQTGYGQGGYGRGQGGYGGQSNYGGQSDYGGVAAGEDYGSSGTSQYGRSHFGWTEPYGEGQQYGGSRGSTGPHRGKGPKGYERSDERIRELVSERLTDHPEIDASEITVTVQGGKVTLEGSVDSRHIKNAVEDIAEQYSQDVQNNLRVNRQGQGQGGSASSGRGASSAGRFGTGTDETDGGSKQGAIRSNH